jgi:hypothetical protein
MRPIRSLLPVAATLAMVVVLAACTQGAGTSPSASAATPEASPSAEAPSESPSAEPTETPSATPSADPSQEAVVDHELPMIGRVVEDTVEVRTEPRSDAPIATGESFTDPGTMPEVTLERDDLVVVTLGPLLNDGESWYEVASVDGDDPVFAFGWVPGDAIERDADLPQPGPVIATISGQGDGDSVSTDVIMGTPATVRWAVAPMAGDDECEIELTVLKPDGLGVNVATETVTELRVEELTAMQLPSLFLEEAGTVTLEVETDCSFAASMTTPPS